MQRLIRRRCPLVLQLRQSRDELLVATLAFIASSLYAAQHPVARHPPLPAVPW